MQHILQYLQGRDSNPSPRYSVIGFTSQPVARFCWKQPHLRSLSSLKCASLELFKSDDSYCNMATLRGPRPLSYTAHPRTILVLSCLSSIIRWLLLCQGHLFFDNSCLFLSIHWLTNPFVQKRYHDLLYLNGKRSFRPPETRKSSVVTTRIFRCIICMYNS